MLLLITSATTCVQHSRYLGTALLWSPVNTYVCISRTPSLFSGQTSFKHCLLSKLNWIFGSHSNTLHWAWRPSSPCPPHQCPVISRHFNYAHDKRTEEKGTQISAMHPRPSGDIFLTRKVCRVLSLSLPYYCCGHYRNAWKWQGSDAEDGRKRAAMCAANLGPRPCLSISTSFPLSDVLTLASVSAELDHGAHC